MAEVLFFVFLFSVAMGSFLNVVVIRLNNDENPLKGRSLCPKCRHQLSWKENIPLLSFVWLRGRCRWCHSPISWQYPLVELAAGLLGGLIFWQMLSRGLGFGMAVYAVLAGLALLGIFVSDLVYQTIPDQLSYFAGGLALIRLLVAKDWPFLVAGLAAGGFFLFLHLITRGKGMALGDVKLAVALGWLLGGWRTVIALYVAFLTGAVVGVALIFLKKKRFGQVIPFGPFLIWGIAVAAGEGDRLLTAYLEWLGGR